MVFDSQWVIVWQWLARLVLCGVFGTAALAKFRNPTLAVTGANELGVPGPMAPLVARALAPLEAAIALALLIVPSVGAVGAMVTLVMFTAALARVLRGGHRPRCFCFGSLSDEPVGPEVLLRNGALLVLAVVVLVAK